jgi:ACS family tartrate transporter-like MFS transporter
VSQAFETALIKKIAWRILPLILVAYCIAYLDRANIAVAALTMNKDLGFSAFTYGLGAGIFFLGYFIFEVPSNLILERVGARRWIARIMFTWGILSGACAFVTGPTSFIVARFLLGVAEAGFFPGVMLYFTYWFPARFRGRITAMLFLAGPSANALSNVAGGRSSRDEWGIGPARLAMAVCQRGCAGCHSVIRRASENDRPTLRCKLART